MLFKKWYKSKTIWGLIIMAIGTILNKVGIHINPDIYGQLVTEAVELVPEIIQVIGGLQAGYGRIKAEGSLVIK